MKTLLTILFLFSALSIYSQTDTTLIEKRFNAAEYNIDMAGQLMQDAANNFNRAWLFGVMGSLTSGVLIAAMEKNENGGINPIAFVPATIGLIGGIWSFFSATGDMREAGYYMRKSKTKFK